MIKRVHNLWGGKSPKILIRHFSRFYENGGAATILLGVPHPRLNTQAGAMGIIATLSIFSISQFFHFNSLFPYKFACINCC